MFLTQRVFASVMETVQINVPLLGDFELYEGYLHFFQSYLNCLIFSFLLKKIVFRVTKFERRTKIQEIPAKNGQSVKDCICTQI